MNRLVINGNSRADEDIVTPSFAPGAPPAVPGPTSFAAPAPPVEESNYVLIQTTGPLSAANKQALVQAEVELLSYKGNNIYLCGYKPKTLDPVQGLDFVEQAEVYHPAYVVESALKSGDQAQQTTVNVSLHPDVVASGDTTSVQAEIASALGVPPTDVQLCHGTAQITVPKSRLPALAVIDAVQNIHEYIEPTLFNHSAGKIMKVHQPVGVANTTYKGRGQTVCVSDTGFDTGNKDQCHVAFGDRVVALYPLGFPRTDTFPGKSDDFAGHGTHVAGSVLGKGTYRSSLDGSSLPVESPASEAKLIFQAIGRWYTAGSMAQFPDEPHRWSASLAGIPTSLIDLFTPILTNHPDCLIHTSSWGARPRARPAIYNDATTDIDTFAWTHKSFLPLFAAGNAGRHPDTGLYQPTSISSQAQAKNCLTVGATESFQPDVKLPPGDEPNPFNNPENVAYFSSRGPASETTSRIKPDVVAPGMIILSTRSSKIDPPAHYSEGWGISHDPQWQYNSGTSMATPLVAGCVAVIRGALLDTGLTTDPSSALIKALLINGTVPLKGTVDGVPNVDSGFGRVNVENTLANIANASVGNGEAGLGDKRDPVTEALGKNGVNPESFTFDIPIPAQLSDGTGGGGITLKITLAYTDAPDEALQNDLNLTVARVGESGEEEEAGKRYGNLGEGVVGRDDVNNVEQVVWRDVLPGGTYRVRVNGYNIPFDVQPFAYAWRLFATPPVV